MDVGLAFPLFPMILSHIRAGKSEQGISFNRIIASQHLVMTFTHLDAFLNDSVRLVCKKQPNVLKSNKEITWERAISMGGWDTLINGFIDKYVYEFGWQNIASRIDFIKNKFGVMLELQTDDLPFLNNAENIRHCFVHNGGRVSQQYLNSSNNSELIVGSQFSIDDEYLAKLTRIVTKVSGELFEKIVEKFFKVKLDRNKISVQKSDLD